MQNVLIRLAVVAAVLAAAIAARSAELKIVGPAGPIAVGESVQLVVLGLDTADRPKAKVLHFPRDGTTCIPATTWAGENFIWWSAKLPGRYLVAIVVARGGELLYAEHVLIVGTAPDPDPDPPDPDPPDPDPDPDAKWQVMFFQESDDLDNYTQGQRTMLAGRKFREELEAKGHTFLGAYDRSAVPKAFVEGANLQPWWNAVKGDPLPRFAIAPVNGGTVQDFPLPKTVAKFYEALEAKR